MDEFIRCIVHSAEVQWVHDFNMQVQAWLRSNVNRLQQ
eukprot:COSAG02_NODE_5405_length_4355_cov_12.651325_4_plen_38_part_00